MRHRNSEIFILLHLALEKCMFDQVFAKLIPLNVGEQVYFNIDTGMSADVGQLLCQSCQET